jgi:putative transcriptional regulator
LLAATDINRGTITRLYKETATRIELDVVEKLCRYLEIEIEELFELVDNQNSPVLKSDD